MSDLYIRPYDTPSVRRRVLLVVAGVTVLAVAIAYFARKGCAPEPEVAITAAEVDADPLVDELLGLPASPALDRTESPPPEPTPPPDEPAPPGETDPGPRLYAAAQAARTAGDLSKARKSALRVLATTRNSAARRHAAELLNEIHIEIITTPRSMAEKSEYTVQPGDSLSKLAKKFNTTIELIRQGNNIQGSMIRVGDRLRIFGGNFKVVIDKSENVLDLYLNDTYFKRYRVGTGEYNRTPVGDFKIVDRIYQPTWFRPNGKSVPYGDPENELGTHWLSLDVKGYGIHGTWEPETIGKQSSAGCVRLLNENIEELYSLLPVGTPVTIVD